MLQISLFGTDILVIISKIKDKFYIRILWISNSYKNLKPH